MTNTPHPAHRDRDTIVTHIDPDLEQIERSIGLLAVAGLGTMLICDGSCMGLSGCSVAPVDGSEAVAA